MEDRVVVSSRGNDVEDDKDSIEVHHCDGIHRVRALATEDARQLATNNCGGAVVEDQPLTPEQAAVAEALGREFLYQLERVAVDMQAAFPRLREIAPPVERQISEDEVEIGFTIDASGIVATLRDLPDGSGTDAFVAAYNARV